MSIHEVAKEVFEIKRRSTLHSVVQCSFPLYAPGITEGYIHVHIRYITQAQLCRIASTKINVFTCSIQCEKTMTAHYNNYYTFTIFCKICRWITCTRLLNLCDAAYVHILVPIYAYTQRCALLGICHESGRCYGQECTSEVLLPRIQ